MILDPDPERTLLCTWDSGSEPADPSYTACDSAEPEGTCTASAQRQVLQMGW